MAPANCIVAAVEYVADAEGYIRLAKAERLGFTYSNRKISQGQYQISYQ
jgi:hypothetical protein